MQYVNIYLATQGNAHRGDYDLSHQVDVAYEEAREVVQHFIHAKRKRRSCIYKWVNRFT